MKKLVIRFAIWLLEKCGWKLGRWQSDLNEELRFKEYWFDDTPASWEFDLTKNGLPNTDDDLPF